MMRAATDADPTHPCQLAKTTRHYAWLPMTNKWMLVGARTMKAKNVDGVIHWFSEIDVWKHVACEKPQSWGKGTFEWWEQNMPLDPLFSDFQFCVISDQWGRRLVFYKHLEAGKRPIGDLASIRESAMKKLRGPA